MLPWLALASLVGSLGARILLRGYDYAGWDTIGPAYGLYVLSTRPLAVAVYQLLRSVVHFGYWNHSNSILFTLLPGALGRALPWEFWGHVLTFLLVLSTFWLIKLVAEIPWRESWLLALAWAASPPLVSFAVTGYPWATGFLPHALALYAVTSPRLRSRAAPAALVCLSAFLLSWNVYESGKTFFLTLLLATLVDRSAPLAARAVWAGTALVQVACLFLRPSGTQSVIVSQMSLGGTLMAALHTLPRLFLGGVLDLPLLLPLALVALLVPSRNRVLVAGSLAFQLLAVVVLTDATSGDLFPRRFLTVTYYAVVALGCAFTAAPTAFSLLVQRMLLVGLLAGNVWQWADCARFFARGPGGRVEPLPFTGAPDYRTFPREIAFARALSQEIRAGWRIVLLYNLTADNEDKGDPAGVLERLYLSLGHEAFERSVVVFGSRSCRYSCVPVHEMVEIDRVLDDLRDDARSPDAMVRACYPRSQRSPRFLDETATVLAGLRGRFSFGPEKEVSGDLACFGLEPLADTEAPRVSRPVARLRSDVIWTRTLVKETSHLKRALGRPFEEDVQGTLTCSTPRDYEFLLGATGEASLFVDGREAVSRRGDSFGIASTRVALDKGRHAIDIRYASLTGEGRLFWDVQP